VTALSGRRLETLIPLACAAATLAFAPPALGDTQVIGPTSLTSGDGPLGCVASSCSTGTFMLLSDTDAGVAVTAPAAGTITSWAVEGATSGTGSIRLRILREVSLGQFKGVGTSAVATAANGTQMATSLPVKKGDRIAVDTDEGASGFAFIDTQSSAGTYAGFVPALADGNTEEPTDTGAVLPELNATLTFKPATKTTVAVSKKGKQLTAKGSVTPFDPGVKMAVTLFRKQGGKFRKVAGAKPPLDTAGKYSAKFNRPKPGQCKVKATFPGDASYKKSSASTSFSC
jgi:hypothetical protein